METAAVVGSSFYAITVNYFIKVCEELGEMQKAEEYRQLLECIKKAVCEEFITEDGTVNSSNLQGLYVMILKADITEGELKKNVLKKLVGLINENGYCLDTGFASVSYLLDTLYENDEVETAYKLLFQTKAPSWIYMVEKGATTIWENWMAILEDGTPTDSSYNHYAFGCVGDWIYRHIGGIQIAEAGYQKILFQPDLYCGLSESNCEVISPYGKVSLHWIKDGDNYTLSGCVPVGCTASLIIGSNKEELKSGRFDTTISSISRC
jgi:alpha-L-rhamnosidase